MKQKYPYKEIVQDIIMVFMFSLFVSLLLLNADQVKTQKEGDLPKDSSNITEQVTIVTTEDVEGLMYDKDTIIIDTRDKVFYEMGHIPNAVNLPMSTIDASYLELKNKLKDAKKIIVYCARLSCTDSQKAGAKLAEFGIKNIGIYKEGYEGWEASLEEGQKQ